MLHRGTNNISNISTVPYYAFIANDNAVTKRFGLHSGVQGDSLPRTLVLCTIIIDILLCTLLCGFTARTAVSP